jgi:two-component system, LytTR family, response regulator LytT
MKILIVEDEDLIAKRIKRLSVNILAEKITSITIKNNIDDAREYLYEKDVDLLLLDLNINGKSGFDLLKEVVAGSFHTIVISAHEEMALESYQYGVLDFVLKPFTELRLHEAFKKYLNSERRNSFPTKYLSVRLNSGVKLIHLDEICYFKGAGVYVDILKKNGEKELYNKSLDRLSSILPNQFQRIHKSYIINLEELELFKNVGPNKIECHLKNGIIIPVSRNRYRDIKEKLN